MNVGNLLSESLTFVVIRQFIPDKELLETNCSPVSMFILLERMKGTETENDVRPKHQLVTSLTCPNEGVNPKPGHWASVVTHHQTTNLFFAG